MYTPPRFLFNAHLETIFPALFRKVTLTTPYTRERITTPDNDFLDLDWLTQGAKDLVIISHGLEGDSHRPYIKGMAAAVVTQGFDVLAWNYRGCSEEMNRQLRFYHSGATDDFDLVIRHAASKNNYQNIYLIGFSLGGNITLKYLGEQKPHPAIRKAVAISVPLDLHTSCTKISRPGNRIYATRFLKSLRSKIIRKSITHPELDTKGIEKINTIQAFDDRYTAPLHGFPDAATYYRQCSSLYFLNGITTPTLILNALNDPFLSPECYPTTQLQHHSSITLETPSRGGHVGFAQFPFSQPYFSELRTIQFLK